MSELQTLPAKELTPQSGQIEISAVPGGLQQKVDGVHLGRKVTPEGNTAGYVDEVTTLVQEAGIGFAVSQGSHGPVKISAVAMEGYKVEAGKLDPETRSVTWSPSLYGSEKVTVAYDPGNLGETPASEWGSTNLGNPGVQVGVVRVTGPDSSVRTFALAAEFTGEPDDWNVHGGIMEVDLAGSQIDDSRASAIEA